MAAAIEGATMRGTVRVILGEGFRVFFLAAGVWGIAAMALWLLHLAAGTGLAAGPHWHAHEMIFGYGAAAVAGFFLTAAPSWTGGGAAARRFIALAALTWLAGRAAMLAGPFDATVVMLVDLAFLPVIALKLAAMLVRRPQARNLPLTLSHSKIEGPPFSSNN